MTIEAILQQAMSLSPEERLQLAEDLWESIETDSASFPLSREERELLAMRLAEAKRNPGIGRTWEEVRDGMLKKIREVR